MSEQQKKTAAILGVFILVLLLFLFRRPASIVQGGSSNMTIGGVTLPGFNYQAGQYPVASFPIGNTDFDLSMINACCSDCSRDTGPISYRPVSGFTYINNEAARGPNIFVYQPPAPPKARSGMGVASFRQG